MNKQAVIAVAVVSAGLAGVICFQAGLFMTRPSRENTATEIASIQADASGKIQASEKKYKDLELKYMMLAKETARQTSLIHDEEGLIRELNNQLSEKEHSLVDLQKEKEMWREKATTKPIEQKVSPPPAMVTQLGPFNVGDLVRFPQNNFRPKVIEIIDERNAIVMLVEPKPGRSVAMSSGMTVSGLRLTPPTSTRTIKDTGLTVVFRNINTDGLISGAWLDLKNTFKITGTTRAQEKTVFVLEPVQ